MSDVAKRLRGGRAAVAKGRLSFDRAEAREKMRKFRLADPHFYVLQFVRAASVLGAKRIEFEFGANHMVCSFDRTLDPDRLDDFWAAVFEARSTEMERALHNVALGIGSAQALKPKAIRLHSGRREILFTDDGETVREVAALTGTRIEMTEKFRLGHLLEFFVDHAEAAALRDYCRYAQLMVIVDGESVQAAEGTHRTDFAAREEAGFVALQQARGHARTTFHFLRDDVLVRTHNVTPDVRAAIGAVNSKTLRTDLSGLELAADEALDHLLYDKLYAAYHASLLRWVEDGVPHAQLMALGAVVFKHFEKLKQMGFVAPPSTRKLADWWLQQKLFAPADVDEEQIISASQAEFEGAIVYSHHRFSVKKLSRYPHVIFANTMEVTQLMHQLRVAGWPTRDVTAELRRAEDADRNRKLWENQPLREDPFSVVVRTVEAGDAFGALLAPFSPRGEVEQLQCEFTTHARGRRLGRRTLGLPIAIFVDGDLQPNEQYLDVVRDARFDELARKLVAQVPYYVREVLKYALAPPRRAELVEAGMKLLRAYLDGSVFQMLADVFDAYVLEIAGEELEVAHETNRLELLERLGEISDLPLFVTTTGEERSMRELYMRERPPVVLDRAVLIRPTAQLLADEGYDVFQVSVATADVLRHLRPDARDSRFVANVAGAARFMKMPPFEPQRLDVLERASHQWVEPEGAFSIVAELLGEGEHSEALFVYRDRLLAQRSWPTPAGRFRIVIHSDDLTPTVDYQDVFEDALCAKAHEAAMSLVRRALIAWCFRARERERLSAGEFRLLWSASVTWAWEEPNVPTVPVWELQGDNWRAGAASLVQIRSSINRDGGVIRVQRGQLPPRSDVAGVVLRAPAGAVLDDLVMARIVEVGEGFDDHSRVAFMARPMVSPEVRGALYRWRGEVEGIHLAVGMFTDEDGGPFGQNVVDMLWQGRRLEQLPDWAPFGQFRTIVHGGPITPDPDFAFVGSGRGAALRAAKVGVAQLLRALCDELGARPSGDLGDLEPLRTDLLRGLAACQRQEPSAPFDLRETLRATPLYPATSGERLAFDQLGELAFEGVVPYVTRPSAALALMLRPDEVSLVEESLGEELTLMEHDAIEMLIDLELGPDDSPSMRDTREQPMPPPLHHDELLARLMHVLDEARRGRTEQLPDSVLMGMRWDDDIPGLCRVDLDGVRLHSQHRLVQLCRADPTDTPMRVLASVISTAVNAHLQVFTDAHELELQAALIASSPR